MNIENKEHYEFISEQLNRLVNKYDSMAQGRLIAHTKDMENVEPLARMVIRLLVEDWI